MSRAPGYCRIEGCENPAGRTGICESHLHVTRKEKRQASRPVAKAAPLRRMPVQKLSEKRVEQNIEYYPLRDKFLQDNPVCQCCGESKSEDVHHRKGRTNELLCEVRYFLAVCRTCHNLITEDSAWAIHEGYSLPRNQTV